MKPLRSVPRAAVVLGVAIGLVIVAFAARIVSELRDEHWRAALRSSGDVASSMSREIERGLQTYDLSLQAIAVNLTTAGVMELPPLIRDRVLFDSSTRARYLGAIVVLDSHGSVYLDSSSPLPRRLTYKDAEFFRFHRTHDDALLHIGRPFRDEAGKDRITLSRRFAFGDGGFAGVVVGTMELAYFQELFSRIDLDPGSVLSLTLDDGTMLDRFPHRASDVGRDVHGSAAFVPMRSGAKGAFRARDGDDDVERQYVFQRVGNFPLLVTVAQSTDAIDAAWEKRAALIGLLTAALLGGCGALALILRRELQRRLSAEAELFSQSERLQVTLGSIGDAVLSTDRNGHVLYMNPVAERLSGWSIDEARGLPSHVVLRIETGDQREPAVDSIALALAEQATGQPSHDRILHCRTGGQFAIEESAAPIRDRRGDVVGAVMVFHDVTEARAMVHRMTHLAQHDMLTDLPNRVLFQDRLAQAIERADRRAQKCAVLFLDIDHFKTVNDSLGHRIGDGLLVNVADRLRSCVREADTVSRQGGDEFVVLLADLADEHGPSRVAECILRALSTPFTIDGQSLSVTASIGVAIYPNDGRDVIELTKNADAAMYLAKQKGRNACQFFTSELGDIAARRLNLERRIAHGLAHGEFVPYYQTLHRASDGMPIGVEALVRWVRDGEIVPPADFIPVAEACGLIVELGDVVLRAACRQAVAWNAERETPLGVAVNVSAVQFRSAGFVDRVKTIVRDSGLDPRRLELEITESVLLDAVDRTVGILQELRAFGIAIALDDFGTGYSSLSYLSRFPVDRIKIDRSFVQSIEADATNRAIVQAVICLGQDLGLKVIAEGVETLEQRKVLTAMGCPELQGYLFGRPAPAHALSVSDRVVA